MSGRSRSWWPVRTDVVVQRTAPFFAWVAEKLDRYAGWDRLPPKLGLFTLIGLRHELRERNLYDTPRGEATLGADGSMSDRSSKFRTLDGSGNDPNDPLMGAAGTRFGRNTPPVPEDEAELDSPPALEVSERLLTRKDFLPAETLNLLAAAWLQFEVHDWFSHQVDRHDPAFVADNERVVGDTHTLPPPLKRDTTVAARYAPSLSDQTHWWDASQLYGARADFADAMRADGGRLKTDGALLCAMEQFTTAAAHGTGRSQGGDTSAPAPNLWVGSALFHILFAKEHNRICDRLAEQYPGWDDDLLYNKARLINTAIMAKIHTVEWTPAIIAHPAAARGVRATWSGLLGDERRRAVRRFAPDDEILSGIRGGPRSHDGVPYMLTEEFVAVYRLHPLIPDQVTFRRVSDHLEMATCDFEKVAVARGRPEQPRQVLEEITAANAFYSLGVAHPGEITLHNYPRFLQELKPLDQNGVLNIGEVDIRRTREVGVPRYNNFRRLFRLPPAASFHEIANGNPVWAKEIRDVYSGKLESVDLIIGMFAERKPMGFAFSDTAFRVFILMAARRLRSDRFFTTDYTPEVYTSLGLKWIEDATLVGMLQHHYPELETVLSGVTNPFEPWPAPIS